jgi:LAO/AO transport system kinase
MDPLAPTALVASIAGSVRAGELRAVARAISLIEAGGPFASALLAALHPHTGRAFTIGITGPPGAGKSTLVARLVGRFREDGQRVGVLAVDPSSPFTGGALLGDRVRMQAHALDRDVFIRSMATRGHLGGLADATASAADVLDAAGFDVILIETVGVGQDELDVARVSDVCVVVTVPEAGDEVQALKAGVMEIADVFVVNKADHPGAERAVAAIEQMLMLDESPHARRPPVVRVVATTGDGVADVVTALARVGADEAGRGARRRQRSEWRLIESVSREAVSRVRGHAASDAEWSSLVTAIEARDEDPHAVARRLLDRVVVAGRLDHVGVATAAIDESVAFFGEALGLPIGAPEAVAPQGVRVRFVETGDGRVELLESIDETSPFAASLRKRGPGLHHLALRVENLAATLDRLAARGVRLIDRVGRAGAHGTVVAFVHPSSTQGVLVELVERARE